MLQNRGCLYLSYTSNPTLTKCLVEGTMCLAYVMSPLQLQLNYSNCSSVPTEGQMSWLNAVKHGSHFHHEIFFCALRPETMFHDDMHVLRKHLL